MTTSNTFTFNTIEEALEDLRQGKIILVTDDPDRGKRGRLHLRRPICHHRKCQLYGHARQRINLYANEHRAVQKAAISADGD